MAFTLKMTLKLSSLVLLITIVATFAVLYVIFYMQHVTCVTDDVIGNCQNTSIDADDNTTPWKLTTDLTSIMESTHLNASQLTEETTTRLPESTQGSLLTISSSVTLTISTPKPDQTSKEKETEKSTTAIPTTLTAKIETEEPVVSSSLTSQMTTQITTITTEKTTSMPLLVTILRKLEWNPDYPNFVCDVLLAPKVKTVLIHQTSKPNCFGMQECVSSLKSMFTPRFGVTRDLNYNFIIGGDGIVYTARGWECRTDNTTRFYTPAIDEIHVGLTGDSRQNDINNLQLDNLKMFLFESSQDGRLKKFVDDYVLKSYHDTAANCWCPIDESALISSCGPCVLKRPQIG